MSMKDAGSLLLGGAAGAAVARYGSNAISNALTKNERDSTHADFQADPAQVSLFKKAPAIDVALGVAAGAIALKVKGLSHAARLAVAGGAAYLVANGALDLVADLTTATGTTRSYNGRPVSETVTGLANPGPLARRMSLARSQALSRGFSGRSVGLQNQVPSQDGKVALL